MCKALQDLSPDLVLIAGDLLDSPKPARLRCRQNSICAFQICILASGVLYLSRNHDVRGGVTTRRDHSLCFSTLRSSLCCDSAVHILDSYTLIGRADYGFSKTAGAPRARFGSGTRPRRPDLAGHSIGESSAQSSLSGSGCWGGRTVFGHTHRGQMFPITAFNTTSV